jgi:GR25 family glycosyltransferase involved in LPS biosynthesis
MKKIKVINLERSIGRRNDFIKNNEGIDYEFKIGVDGNLLSEDDIFNENHFLNPLSFPSRGVYGVALSHLNLWNHAIELNESVTIAEDDAIFRADFEIKSSEVIDQLPLNWDIVLWGWNFDSILSIVAMPEISPSVMIFDQELLRNNIDKFKKERSKVYPFKLDKCFGTLAYTISPAGAEKFKKLCFPLKNFWLYFPILNKHLPNTGIDIAMNRIYSETLSFVSFPPLAVSKNERHISTAQK